MKHSVFFIITTVLWGLNYHWSKSLLTEVTVFEGAFWRYCIAVFTLFILSIKTLPNLKTISLNLKGILLIGGIGLFGFNYFFFLGMNETSPLNAALIIGLNPALTLILSRIILKTSISPKQIIGMFLALAGVIFLLLKGNVSEILNMKLNKGDINIMICSVFFALHHVWVKKFSNASITNSQFSLMTAITCFISISLLLGVTSVGITAPQYFSNIMNHSSNFWLSALGIGALGTGLAYWFWYKGIKDSSAATASVFINIVPLSTAFFHVIFGSKLEYFHIVSGLIVISGILLIQIKKPLSKNT